MNACTGAETIQDGVNNPLFRRLRMVLWKSHDRSMVSTGCQRGRTKTTKQLWTLRCMEKSLGVDRWSGGAVFHKRADPYCTSASASRGIRLNASLSHEVSHIYLRRSGKTPPNVLLH